MRTELQVPSDLKFLSVVEHWLLESLRIELQQQDEWPDMMRRLRLALVEAYSNVVRHAHASDPSLPVMLRLELSTNLILIEIWDQGEGYDPSIYLPPSPQDRQEGGYGWMILSRLMDKVQYQIRVKDNLNCLRLETQFDSVKRVS